MRLKKRWYATKREAAKALRDYEARTYNYSYQIFKQTWGKHKNMYFVGLDIEWLNINY